MCLLSSAIISFITVSCTRSKCILLLVQETVLFVIFFLHFILCKNTFPHLMLQIGNVYLFMVQRSRTAQKMHFKIICGQIHKCYYHFITKSKKAKMNMRNSIDYICTEITDNQPLCSTIMYARNGNHETVINH